MRSRVVIVVLGSVLLLGLWWMWPRPVEVQEPEARVAAKERVRKVFRQAREIDPATVEALREALSTPVPLDPPAPAEPDDEPPTVELVVDVVNEDGRPEDRARVQVFGCPVVSRSGQVFRVAPGLECKARAWRKEGMIQVPSDVESVVVGPDGAYVQLELPRARMGGLGVRFRPHPEGMVVVSVNPGTPAEAMGLQHGDVITAVDGVPASSLDTQEFVRTLSGPVGSEVDFTIRYQEDGAMREATHTLERAFLEG
jgi:hypothetical protein